MAFDFARWLAYRKLSDPFFDGGFKIVDAIVGTNTSEGNLVHIGNYISALEDFIFENNYYKYNKAASREEINQLKIDAANEVCLLMENYLSNKNLRTTALVLSAQNYLVQGKIGQAISLYEELLDDSSMHPNFDKSNYFGELDDLGRLIHNICLLYQLTGKNEKAESLYLENKYIYDLSEIYEKKFASQHPNLRDHLKKQYGYLREYPKFRTLYIYTSMKSSIIIEGKSLLWAINEDASRPGHVPGPVDLNNVYFLDPLSNGRFVIRDEFPSYGTVDDDVVVITGVYKELPDINRNVELDQHENRLGAYKVDKTPAKTIIVDEQNNPYQELNQLIGLDVIKEDITSLANLAKTNKKRSLMGLPTIPTSQHLVFSGNPGTGKTTVARILAKIYKDIGVLSKGHLIEVDRAGLVAGYVGQTAIKTKEKIDEALGGILFIDEAYTLVKDGNDFGQEAIDTILKAMEDHRDDFIVIVAGYTEEMKEFINSNPGLKSRFSKYIEFPDYNKAQLAEIFVGMCEKYQLKFTKDAIMAVTDEIKRMVDNKDVNFANARAIRNLFERIVTKQANRVSNNPDSNISLIEIEDVL